jgi:hypothetical protein
MFHEYCKCKLKGIFDLLFLLRIVVVIVSVVIVIVVVVIVINSDGTGFCAQDIKCLSVFSYHVI